MSILAKAPTFLVSVARERARVLAPTVFACLVFYAIAARPLGIYPGAAALAATWILVAVLGALTLAIVTRRVPDRWVHLASTAVVWCPTAATAISLYTSRNELFALFFVIQIASSGVLLDTRLVVATLVTVTCIGIPLLLHADEFHAGMFIPAIVMAVVFAMLIHRLVRSALVRAETHRLAEVATNQQLARQLAELEQAHRERTSLQEQLLHAQRMEAVGTLAAGVAHDMNNVLASITSLASLMRDDGEPSDDVTQILAQAERGASLTRGLLAFSRRGRYRKQIVSIGQVVRDVLPLLARTLPKAIEIRCELSLEEACVDGDPVHLQQALINFGLNAAEAMNGSGVLVITGDVVELDGASGPDLPRGRYARLCVTDTGKGMGAATRLRVFEPFFTTKPLGEGTGLGLSTVWGVVQAHDGAVDVQSELGKGSTFRIHLPLTTRRPSAEASEKLSQPIRRKSLVLVVDDEPAVRDTTKRLLEKMGLSVLTATNGEEGLRELAEHAATIELVVLDMGMPVMGGAECFRKLREWSAVPVLISTGYAVEEEAQAMVAAGASIIEKPFPSADLRRVVAQLLNH